jgi:hypothetical protein
MQALEEPASDCFRQIKTPKPDVSCFGAEYDTVYVG